MANVGSNDNRDFAPGVYELNKLVMVNYLGERIDISNLIHNFQVVESINSLFCIYQFTVIDAVNLLEKYIVTGNEKLEMILLKKDLPESEEVQLERHLIVTGITNYAKPSNEGQAYQLRAITETAFAASIKRISRADNGNVVSMIQRLVSEVVNRDSLQVLTDPDVGNFKVVYPNYTVLDIIMMLLTRAQRTDGSVYYMFETLFNNIVLTSYEEMVSREAVDEYMLRNKDQYPVFSAENFEHNRRRILSIDSKLGASQFDGFQSGANNSRVYSLDLASKTYEVNDYSILNINLPKIQKDYTLHPNLQISGTPISDYVNAKEYFVNKNTMAFSNSENLNNRYDSTVAQRSMVTENQYAVSHVVRLNGDTRIRAGEIIELDIPPSISPDVMPDDYQDLIMSGRYLVASVVHEFDFEGRYFINVSVRKDSIDRNSIVGKYEYLENL